MTDKSKNTPSDSANAGPAGPAGAYLLEQIDRAIGYYARASKSAKGSSLAHISVARTSYLLAGVILAVSFAGGLDPLVVAAPPNISNSLALAGLPASAPKWSFGFLSFGYLLSQYAQRRGFTRAWTRYAECEQAICGLRRQLIVTINAGLADDTARKQLLLSTTEQFNQILMSETQRWAQDVMADFDRVHALLDKRPDFPGARPAKAC